MGEEKLKILEMIQEGKISAAEGMELLKAFEDEEGRTGATSVGAAHAQENSPQAAPAQTGAAARTAERFLRIRVIGDKSTKVNVNIPFSLIRSASKLVRYALAFIPPEARAEMEKKGIDPYEVNVEELVQLLEEGTTDGKLVDIETEDEHEGKVKVEVCVE
ncbi:hypothetical protein CEB3_c21650 [Peptococcaceae bacterium CEB3]|nr:hypothetical protein CEB3_c21650 [Peptococcaceae bacterium CEB3]